jgi:hypothetical protein
MPHVFPPSRGEGRWRAASYLFIALVGLYTMVSTDPDLIERRLGWIGIVWSLFMLMAIPAAGAVLIARYRIESIMLPIFGSALLVAVINAWARVLWAGQQTNIPVTAISTALLCLLIVRGLQLHRIVKAEPWITTAP